MTDEAARLLGMWIRELIQKRDALEAELAEWRAGKRQVISTERVTSTVLGDHTSLAAIAGAATAGLEREGGGDAALMRVIDERDGALAERDAARESAITWANAPIARLVAAYMASSRDVDLHVEHVEHVSAAIRAGTERGWRISWRHWDGGFWHGWHTLRGTLDEACTSAAEQIEDAS